MEQFVVPKNPELIFTKTKATGNCGIEDFFNKKYAQNCPRR